MRGITDKSIPVVSICVRQNLGPDVQTSPSALPLIIWADLRFILIASNWKYEFIGLVYLSRQKQTWHAVSLEMLEEF